MKVQAQAHVQQHPYMNLLANSERVYKRFQAFTSSSDIEKIVHTRAMQLAEAMIKH